MVEQLICNQQVKGSSPFVSSVMRLRIAEFGLRIGCEGDFWRAGTGLVC